MTTGPVQAFEYYHPTEVRVGDALGRTFDVLFRNFPAFIAISAIATLPSFLTVWWAATHPEGAGINSLLNLLVTTVLSALCEAMIVYAAFQSLRGRPVSIGASIARGLQRFVPVILASLAVAIVVALGSLLLVVPGLIAMTMFFLTMPACVVERLGPIDSMSRSSELTRGYRWPIFGAIFVVGLVGFVGTAIIAALTAHPDTLLIYALLIFVWGTLSRAYQTVLAAILYHDLRVVKEGIDLEHIASVFD